MPLDLVTVKMLGVDGARLHTDRDSAGICDLCAVSAVLNRTVTPTVVTASREIAAPADKIFELIADPALQPQWDGNDNLAEAAPGQRVRTIGDVFTTTLTMGADRTNHVVEFEEGRLIAWQPSEPGKPPPGHLWRWKLEPVSDSSTMVTHTYDWSLLTDEHRLARARATTADKLLASIERLAALAERS
jgi:uncharacterized protein YndB with AHSA1/START domain